MLEKRGGADGFTRRGRFVSYSASSAGYGNIMHVMGLKGMDIDDEGRDHDHEKIKIKSIHGMVRQIASKASCTLVN